MPFDFSLQPFSYNAFRKHLMFEDGDQALFPVPQVPQDEFGQPYDRKADFGKTPEYTYQDWWKAKQNPNAVVPEMITSLPVGSAEQQLGTDTKIMSDEINDIREDTGFDMNSLSGLSSAFGTMTGIITGAMRNSQIADVTEQEKQIEDKANLGRTKFSNFNQLSNAYGLLNIQPDLNYDIIRGGSDSERFGNTLSNVLTGASLGIQNGSAPLGLAFAGIGGLAAGLEWGKGNWLASEEQRRLKFENQVAGNRAERNISYGGDQMIEDRFRSHTAKEGGPINRKTESVKDFANRVLEKGKSNDVTRSSGITRERVKGGVKIKIKR